MTSKTGSRSRTAALGGALAIVVVVGGVWLLTADGEEGDTNLGASTSQSPTPSSGPVDLDGEARAAVQDDLAVLVPSGLPKGWQVTAASYDEEARTWHVAMATAEGSTIELDQRETELGDLVEEVLPDAEPGDDLDLRAFQTGTWSTWTTSDAWAAGRELEHSSILVRGAREADVTVVAQRLLTPEYDRGGEGD